MWLSDASLRFSLKQAQVFEIKKCLPSYIISDRMELHTLQAHKNSHYCS